MTPVSIRFPPALYERCAWAAAADGLNRATWIRSVCTRAAREAKPPIARENGLLSLPPETWKEWQDWANQYGEPIDNFVGKIVNDFINRKKAYNAAQGTHP